MSSRHTLQVLTGGALFIAICSLTAPAGAGDCQPQWDTAISENGPSGTVRALLVFDEGDGEKLYVGGSFGQAGGIPVNGIARYDLETGTWSSMAGGTSGTVWDIAVFDGELYIAGGFNFAGGTPVGNVARWNGLFWQPLGFGTDDRVRALAVIEDGPGAGLYAGGDFTTAGQISASHIARWDGEQWHALGDGANNDVRTMAVYDDGSGPALYAGGSIQSFGNISANGIARWDPVTETWSALGAGTSTGGLFPQGPWTMTVYNGELIVGGNMPQAGGMAVQHIARWNGSQWLAMTGGGMVGAGSGAVPTVLALHVFDDGEGEALYAGGLFTTAGGVSSPRIARWTIDGWSAVGGGVGPDEGTTPSVRAFADLGPDLFVGGFFNHVGELTPQPLPAANLVTWRGCAEPEPVPGDLTGDGTVGVDDLLILLAEWGPCPPVLPADCPADLTGDGNVGVDDLLILLSNWG